jgi:DNA-binding CsgD family transcriptional regulator
VQDVASERAAAVVGREPELALVRGLLDTESPTRALVLTGEPGIGKTTLWEAGIDAARERGMRVLSARPSGAEARLTFAALIDLCDCLATDAFDTVPGPQRAALDVALLRAEPADAPPEPQAIALGLLNALRAAAAREPLLVAIDDVQWLDAPSADALAFAARRLVAEPVRFLLAKRPARPTAIERAIERGALARAPVGPLSLGATRHLLAERLGLSVSHHLLRRIVDTTLGNPLFALEVGRTLLGHGPPAVGEEIPLPDAVEELLASRVASLSQVERRLLLAVALSADLHTAELGAVASAPAVEDAIDAGLLLVDSDRVRAAHPLLAAVTRKRARRRERRELHRALAGAVADRELRALHLALAAERADDDLAATLAAAAAAASARGARQEAVQLGEHALRLTPREAPERGDRLLALGGYLETAGALRRLTDLLRPELPSLPAGAVRARAWLLLSEGADPRNLDDLEHHLDMALAECEDDPWLRAYVLAKKSANASASAVSRIGLAEAWALQALEVARNGRPDVERLGLYALSWARALSGRSIDELALRSRAVSDAPAYIAAAPDRIAGQRLVWRGEVERARAALTELLALADARGEPASYALLRLHVCELELRAGGWDVAARLLDEWAESSDRELLIRPMYQRCRALLAAGRGLAGDAERWATDAIARAETVGSRWDGLEARRALGIAALLAHEPARAAESLRAVWEHTLSERVDEPGVFPVAPDLVEALAQLGELDEARAVSDRLRDLADAQAHPWGRATAARCDGLIRLASDRYDEDAAAALTRAAADYEALGLRFDRARTLSGLGRAQRRVRKWGAARDTLQAAASAFDDLGSTGWAELARSELGRVGARRPSPSGELTPTERRTVELAAEGLSNKQIAQAMYVTVHTVEVHLSRAYAKLGVRSRAQLARRLAVKD